MYQQINNEIVERIASVGLGYDEYLLLFALAFMASGNKCETNRQTHKSTRLAKDRSYKIIIKLIKCIGESN
jgi:hypothetical protein